MAELSGLSGVVGVLINAGYYMLDFVFLPVYDFFMTPLGVAINTASWLNIFFAPLNGVLNLLGVDGISGLLSLVMDTSLPIWQCILSALPFLILFSIVKGLVDIIM